VRFQSLLIGAFALVFGGSAAVGVNTYLKGRGTAVVAETLPVVVAAIDVHRGDTISADLVAVRDYPKEMVPEGALTKVEDAVDRAVAIPLVKGEVVLDAKLSAKGAGRGLAALVPTGMRAVTIQTTKVSSGVAGLVMPGNKVDVLLTVSDNNTTGEDATGGGTTTTLLQRVEILAVDQRFDAPADNKVDVKELRSVTLLVTPHQANLLELGQNKGTLHLSLRNPDDDRDSGARPVTLADLRYKAERPWDERLKSVLEAMAKAQAAAPKPVAPAAPEPVVAKAPEPPPAPAPIQIRTIRGASEGSVLFHAVAPPPPPSAGGER